MFNQLTTSLEKLAESKIKAFKEGYNIGFQDGAIIGGITGFGIAIALACLNDDKDKKNIQISDNNEVIDAEYKEI